MVKIKGLRESVLRLLPERYTSYIRYWTFSKKLKEFMPADGTLNPVKGVYEPEMEALKNLIERKKPEICIDVGASYGSYAYFLSRLLASNQSEIFSFEPVKSSYHVLAKTKKKFKLDKVHIFNVALSDKEGEATMEIPKNVNGLAFIQPQDTEKSSSPSEKVRLDKLDNFLRHFSKEVGFIKCDVEGSEFAVFTGAKKLLDKFKPLILCEIEQRHLDKYGISPEATPHLLKSHGYSMFIWRNNRLEQVNNLVEGYSNYFFIHKTQISEAI